MKRNSIAFFMLICILLTFCGCNKKNDELPNIDKTTAYEEPTTELVKEIKGTKVEGMPKLIDLGDVFYVEEYTLDEVMVYSDEVLLVVNRQSMIGKLKIRLYNIYTGEFLHEYNYDHSEVLNYEVEILSDGRIAVYSDTNVDVRFLTNELKDESRIVNPNGSDEMDIYTVIKDGSGVYYFETMMDNILFKKTGNVDGLKWNEEWKIVNHIKNATADGKYLIIHAVIDDTLKYVLYNTQTQSCSIYDAEESYIEAANNILLYDKLDSTDEYVIIIDPTKPRLSQYVKLAINTENAYSISIKTASQNSILSCEVNENASDYATIFKQYDINTGDVLKSFELKASVPYVCRSAQCFNQNKMMLLNLEEIYDENREYVGKEKVYILLLEEGE